MTSANAKQTYRTDVCIQSLWICSACFLLAGRAQNIFNRLRRGHGDLGEMQMDTMWEPDTWHFAQPRSLYWGALSSRTSNCHHLSFRWTVNTCAPPTLYEARWHTLTKGLIHKPPHLRRLRRLANPPLPPAHLHPLVSPKVLENNSK